MISEMISDYAYCNRLDPDGTITSEWITDSFERMTGYPPHELAELESQHRFALFHPDDHMHMERDMAKLLTGEAVDAEYLITTRNGEIRWVHMYRRPVWDDEQKRVVRYYGVARDITERKRAEEELQRHNTILEAVSAATSCFLKASDWQEEIRNVLGILGKAANTDRARFSNSTWINRASPWQMPATSGRRPASLRFSIVRWRTI